MNVEFNGESPEDIDCVIQLYFHRMTTKIQKWWRMLIAKTRYRLLSMSKRIVLGVGQLLLEERTTAPCPKKQEGIRFRWVGYFDLHSHKLCFLVKSYYRGSSWNLLQLPVSEFTEVKTASLEGIRLFHTPLHRDYLGTIRKPDFTENSLTGSCNLTLI